VSFISPMLARPLPERFYLTPGYWWAEKKEDGHRLIIEIGDGRSSLFADKTVRAWSRYGLPRILPTHLMEDLSQFPNIVLDGELNVPGMRSYGVTELVNSAELVYTAFDILEINGEEVMNETYLTRRQCLDAIFEHHHIKTLKSIVKNETTRLDSWPQMLAMRDEVWAADGEGLILKKCDSIYQPGKRPKDWIKIKDKKSTIVTVIGFVPSTGTIVDRGPCAITMVQDAEGNEFSVKTRNDALCAQLAAMVNGSTHPMVGRKLRIEFQERTPDGSYRHPRWDRWEDE
jgi:ATP-dependent DNA ligase